jgi:hypothetical protein
MNAFKRAASFRAWSVILFVLILPAAKADILRLRDGRMFTGEFLGATKDQIWFQGDAPGNIISPAAYSVAQVESLTFGPAEKQSKAAPVPQAVVPIHRAGADCRNAVDAILVTLARESQKINRPPDQ